MTEWEALIQRYCPEGKRVCNCRQAYETHFPPETSGTTAIVDGEWKPVAAWGCEHGCSANALAARDHVAKCLKRDLP